MPYHSDGRPALARIDPDDCGCTDCLIGYSRPMNEASNEQLAAVARGELANGTDLRFTVQADGLVTSEYGQALARLDPEGCGCTDCLTGYSRPIDMASDEQLAACARGELQNASGMFIEA